MVDNRGRHELLEGKTAAQWQGAPDATGEGDGVEKNPGHGRGRGHAYGHTVAVRVSTQLAFAFILAQSCAAPARRADAPPTSQPPAEPPPTAQALSSPADEEPQLDDGALSGDPEGAREIEVWIKDVQRAVRDVWPPKGQRFEGARGSLAKLRVQVRHDGTLHSPTLVQSSGDVAFDQSCREAIELIKMAPPSPKMLRRLRQGFILSFDGRGR
jgi:TonB family protein